MLVLGVDTVELCKTCLSMAWNFIYQQFTVGAVKLQSNCVYLQWLSAKVCAKMETKKFAILRYIKIE